MPDVLTLTMNPAIDLSTSVDRLVSGRKLRCGPGVRDAGGGGINVARVARRLGANVKALFPVGGPLGDLLTDLLAREGVAAITSPIRGETRECVNVLDRSSGEEFRLVLPGPSLDPAEWQDCLDRLSLLCTGDGIVCASGSLPPGAPSDFFRRVVGIAKDRGARVVLDTSGPPLKAALEAGVWLMKPNLQELQELSGAPLDSPTDRIAACRELVARGAAQAVALTLGAAGALLITGDSAWSAPPLPIRAVSTVGAGDSFVGAMVWALASDLGLAEAFRYGVAAGTAAVMSPVAGLAKAGDVHRLVGQVAITEVS